MNAVVIRRYGPPEENELTQLAIPKPKPGQLLVRIHFAAVNPVDWKTRYGRNKFVPMGGGFPKVLGHDFSGTVVDVGSGVKKFKAGDEVFAMQGLAAGAYAEYITVAAGICAKKPPEVSHEEAAAVPLAGLTSLQALRNVAGIGKGTRVLINGASGGVGIFAVQIAKHFGAYVIATCSHGSFELIRSLGADECIDYKAKDFTDVLENIDIVYDCVGNRSFNEVQKVLSGRGVYISTHTQPAQLVTAVVANMLRSQKDKQVLAIPNGKDMDYLASLMELGQMKSVIDRRFPLARLKEAHEYSESGRAKGKITIDMGVQ